MDSITSFNDDYISFYNQQHEKASVYKYLINHSLNLVLSKYRHVFKNLDDVPTLNQFLVSLFERSQITLQDFQKIYIILINFLNLNLRLNSLIKISIKQLFLALVMKYKRKELEEWETITGLKKENLKILIQYVDVLNENNDYDNEEQFTNIMCVKNEEVQNLNNMMRSLVYKKFQIIS